ncbi:Ldh family oxidoreductase [Nonomuraea sp. NPDC049400]|uniref:Ldh family oxidoreductase n=1 Tax=Nonomuraea sp. NPDC049400 TaxID=3364352 RepID=UPI00379B7172
MSPAKHYRLDDLRDWATRLVHGLGTPSHVAQAVSRNLVDADAAGHVSHGLGMLPVYIDQIHDGSLIPAAEPELVSDQPGHIVVDGRHGFGHHTVEWALDIAVERARTHGLCAASLVRTGHVGRLGGYTLAAARRSCAALLCVGTIADRDDALVAPPDGVEPMLGTNPISFAHPGDPPVVVDLATSALAYYDLVERGRRGESVPPGTLKRGDGTQVTDASAIFEGSVMQPFGGYKGYGLSLMAGLLSGLGADGHDTAVRGGFLLVIDVAGSVAPANAAEALRTLRASATVPGCSHVSVPGDRSHLNQMRSRAAGIPLPDFLERELAERRSHSRRSLVIPPLPSPIPALDGVPAQREP